MTTLAADSPMTKVTGEIGSIPIIANDIVFEGAMVGENGSGYGRPLVAGDRFRGHAVSRCDNTVTGPNQVAGSAGDMDIELLTGRYRLVVSLAGAVTDVGQPVYASDDATYSFVGASASGANSYVGVAVRYVSSTKMEVEFRVGECDEFGPNLNRVLKTDDYTTLAADNGKIIYVVNASAAKTITLIATVAGYNITVVYAGSDAADEEIAVDPNANDKFLGGCGNAAGGDGKKLTNTTATARRGDFLQLLGDGGDGWNIINKRGTWAQES